MCKLKHRDGPEALHSEILQQPGDEITCALQQQQLHFLSDVTDSGWRCYAQVSQNWRVSVACRYETEENAEVCASMERIANGFLAEMEAT